MGYLERYFLYLLSLGYSTSNNIKKTNTTISNYVDAIDDIAKLEGYQSGEDMIATYHTISDLSDAMQTLFIEYSDVNKKGNLLPSNNKRTVNGLKHFSEFLSHCNQ